MFQNTPPLIEAEFFKNSASIKAEFRSFFGPKMGEKNVNFSFGAYQSQFQHLFGRG